MIKPAGSDTKPPIVAGSLGSNPAGPQVSFNFVTVPSSTFDSVNDQAYGHVTFDVTGNSYSGTSHRWAIDGTALADGPSTFTGDNGMMTDTGGGATATGAMTPSGVCVLDYGPGNGGTIGVKQPSANVDVADIATKTFKGFLINAGKTQCVACTPNGDGTLHGNGYAMGTGVETGTFDGGGGVTISFIAQPNPGILKMSVATDGGGETIAAAVNQVNGKYMIFGFGYGSGKGYNVILVQQ